MNEVNKNLQAEMITVVRRMSVIISFIVKLSFHKKHGSKHFVAVSKSQ